MSKFLNNINLEAGNDIQFKTTAGANAGKIEQDGDDLVLSNTVGDVLLGDGSSDVYIGDGTSNVDILFEQSGSIKGDGSAITLTIGGANTTLNLENPNINGTLSLGATSINNKLTFTSSSGYILFDYEPTTAVGEYTTEVPLLKVDRSGSELTVLSRLTNNGAIALGNDDTVAIVAGDVKNVIKDNLSYASENVIFASEGGFYAYGFPSNDTAWSNRNEFRFRSDSGTASDNGLYIGDGSSTQFIDLSRNLKNIGTINSGAITSTGSVTATSVGVTNIVTNRIVKFNGSILDDSVMYDDGTNIGIGTTSPEDRLDVVGQLRISANKTADTNKTNRIRGEHYDIAEEPTTFMFMNNFSTTNILNIGGGSSIENAATQLNFYTAANNTTTTGTSRMTIDSSGNVGIGTASPDKKLNVHSGTTSDIVKFQNNNGSIVIGKTANLGSLDMASDASFRIRHGSTVSAFFKSDGNVGIGTTSPSAKLHIGPDPLVTGYTSTITTLAVSDTANGAELILRGQSPRLWFDSSAGGIGEIYLDSTHLNFLSGDPRSGNAGSSSLYIKSNGHIGIGTDEPSSKLHILTSNVGVSTVYANVAIEGVDAQLDLTSSSSGSWGSAINFVEGASTSANTDVWSIARQTTGGSGDSSLRFNFGTSNQHINDSKITFTSTGRVGIGTTSPTSPLTIKSNSVSSADSALTIQGNSNTNAIVRIAERATDGGRFHMYDGGVEKIAFYTDGTDNHISAGNVGIGDTTPSYKLDVNGTLRTTGQAYFNSNVTITGSATMAGGTMTGNLEINTDRAVYNASYFGTSTASTRSKIRFYGTDATYAIGMQNNCTYGGLGNTWAMTFQFSNANNRGFWWGDSSHSQAQGAMALTTDGNLTVASRIRVGYGESDTTTPATYALDATGEVAVTSGDVELTTASRGIILKSPNGTRYLVNINDSGELTTSAV